MIHKPKCEKSDLTIMRTSSESRLHWKYHFHKNPFYFRNMADSEAVNEIEDNNAVCNETTNICKQNPICNAYYIISELNDVLKIGYYKSPLEYEHID